MQNDLRIAAKLTAQALRISALEREVSELKQRAETSEKRAEKLTVQLDRRCLTVRRIRSRLQQARASRDLWKHRCLRDA